MKKWSIGILTLSLWLAASPIVCTLAAEANAQSELDKATAEEAKLQAKLLEMQEKKKQAKDRLEKQAALMKEIDNLKVQLAQNSQQSKEAQDTLKKSEADFQVLEKTMAAEEQKVKPFKDSLDKKILDHKNLETLVLNQQAQLKKLDQEISFDQKQYSKMTNSNSGMVKKLDSEKGNLEKNQGHVSELKKDGEELQAKIVIKQKELDSL